MQYCIYYKRTIHMYEPQNLSICKVASEFSLEVKLFLLTKS